jgi:hypothetical protein
LRLVLCALALAAGVQGAAAAELLMFEDPGCSWCRRWLAEVGPGYANTEEGRLAPLRRIDIRDQARARVVLERRVTVTPTFVLVEGGREVGRLVGYPGSEFFYGMLGELLARLPKPPQDNRLPVAHSGHDAPAAMLRM